MERKIPNFHKQTTNTVKGLMLISMFILHMFAMPESYVDPSFERFAIAFGKPFGICVPVFAFLTGYFYFFTAKKSYGYSFKKIGNIMVPYWITYAILLSMALMTKTYRGGVQEFVLELFALYRPVMWFCWYVAFYVAAMLLLPITTRFCRGLISDVIFGMALPYVVGVLLNHYVIRNYIISRVIADVLTYYPVISLGYLSAHLQLFEKADHILRDIPENWCFLGKVLLAAAMFFGQDLIFGNSLHGVIQLPIWYGSVLVFVYALIGMISMKQIALWRWIEKIGEKSMLMWFVHSIFFNVSKEIFQPILYAPKNPILVLLWGLTLCYAAAVLIDVPTHIILKKFAKKNQ